MENPDPAPSPILLRQNGPIGVFDSGVGGLTVVAALRAALPDEAIIYMGDTARVPYGTRSGEVVRRYAKRCAQFLWQRGAKLMVVACNTATAYALADLQAELPIPVLGVIEAGASLAASHCPQGTIGVIATEGTVASQAYQKALGRLAPKARVMALACPMFVPLCEENLLDHPATALLAEGYLAPLIAWPAQAVVLGCTHYPLLLPLFTRLFGSDVRIIDSAQAVAQAVNRALTEGELHTDSPLPKEQRLQLFASDVTPRIKKIAAQFLGEAALHVESVDL
jgi:glutamate racemase